MMKQKAQDKGTARKHRYKGHKKDKTKAKGEPLHINLTEERQSFFHDGVLMSEAILVFPTFTGEGAAALENVYQEAKNKCLAYAEGKLFDLSKARFEENHDPRRRFTHRRLILTHKVTITLASETHYSMIRELSISYRGRIVYAKVFGETLDRATGFFCPMTQFLSKPKKKKQNKTEKTGKETGKEASKDTKVSATQKLKSNAETHEKTGNTLAPRSKKGQKMLAHQFYLDQNGKVTFLLTTK